MKTSASMPVDPLAEEFVAVAAIFPECVSREGDASRTIKIHPRSSKELNTPSLTLNIPLDYPQSPPTLAAFMGISPSIAQNLLQSSWSPGEVCLYPLIESLRETLSADLPVTRSCDTSESISNEPRSEVISNDIEVADLRKYAFATSAAIVDRKSVFVGRAIEVHSRAEAQSALLWLKENDKKVARATHNIVAWRFMENGVLVKGPIIWLCDLIQDNDDDGEDAAGARIAHLLEIMDLTNIMVIVSRWYGGVLLHGDRFKHISNAAREALEVGGFLVRHNEKKEAKRKTKKTG